MSKLIDVLSTTGLRTGETLPRAEIHGLGKLHRAVHLYIFNSNNELLLQQRSLTVDHAPGVFALSLTAHIDAGEFSSTTVRREVKEELGLDPSQMTLDFVFSFYQEATLNETYIDRQFIDIYVARVDVDAAHIRFDPAEVSDVKFVPFEEFHNMVSDSSSYLAPVYGDEWRDLRYFLDAWLEDR